MTCEECRDLETHVFRSVDDMVNAVQVAAAEVDRGVLERIHVEDLRPAEEEAMSSVFSANALPGTVRYRFKCTVCGDRFELYADTTEGTGGWTRAAPSDRTENS